MIKILLFIWQLPQIILGKISVKILKADVGFSYMGKNIYRSKKIKGGVSLGNIIIIQEANSVDLTRFVLHEYGHSRQSVMLGWFYLIVVGIPSLIRCAIWNIFKLKYENYFKGFPEKWADRLGGNRRD